MPFVSCSAAGCIYNCSRQCGLTALRVSGEKARRAAATCCTSFCGDGDPAALRPDEFSAVSCSAETCRHNVSGRCEAGCIDVRGQRAVCAEQTECASFAPNF